MPQTAKEKEIFRNMVVLGLTREQAEQLYIDDRAKEPLPEQKELEQKAKANRVYNKSLKPRATVTKTPNTNKLELYNAILSTVKTQNVSVTAENLANEISVFYKGDHYSIKIIKHK